MIRKSLFSVIVLLSLLISSLLAYAQDMRPQGRYCGKVYHNGYMVNVEMTLEISPTGSLTGSMRYRDGEVVTEGKLTQISPPAGQRETLKWADKYGTGYAFLEFSSDFSTFTGAWGSWAESPKQPTNPWTGKRCNGFIS
ncbi:hypothetical protein [Bartonella sp. HY761]|uniref:hypothetical protein n=1 Tax=Bartonella sp. HY761 TaxID=2979330 RepID=UPI0022033BAD|nr:hypothetical protein [Bartonella sp. HY761]UXN06482.1 hypothetical protein N6A79_00175 [Bartonella sp. HY761]